MTLRSLSVAFALLGSAPALACSCEQWDPLKAAALGRFRVFSARVVDVIGNEHVGDYSVLEVQRVWSGALFRYTLLKIEIDSCGHPDVWTLNSEHLLVTDAEGALVGSTTNDCMGNEPLSTAGKTLSSLGAGTAPLPTAVVALPLLALLGGVLAGRRFRRGRTSA